MSHLPGFQSYEGDPSDDHTVHSIPHPTKDDHDRARAAVLRRSASRTALERELIEGCLSTVLRATSGLTGSRARVCAAAVQD